MRAQRRFRLAPIPFVIAAALASAPPLAQIADAAPTPPRTEPSASTTPPTPSTDATPNDENAAANRALAEKEYKKGYKDSQDATKLKQKGKTAESTEKFGKALQHFEEAIRLYEPYAEAWNMVGYCSRNVGDLRRAFDAYDRSLAIKPDYEEAHEYVGEAYLMAGNIEKAKEQLAWLTARKSDEAKVLAEAIEAAEKGEKPASTWGAAPAGEKAPATAAPASPDSAAADSTAHPAR